MRLLYVAFKRLERRRQSHLCRIKTMHSDLKILGKWHVKTWEEPRGGAEDVKKLVLKNKLINIALEVFNSQQIQNHFK